MSLLAHGVIPSPRERGGLASTFADESSRVGPGAYDGLDDRSVA